MAALRAALHTTCGGAGEIGGRTVARGAAGPATLTLPEALALARRYNLAYRAVTHNERVADWSVAEPHGAFLPRVSVSSDLSYQLAGTPRIGGLPAKTWVARATGRSPSRPTRMR